MTEEMNQKIDKYWDENRFEEIEKLIVSLPKEEQDLELRGLLIAVYNNLSRYEDAVELAMELQEESKEIISWYYRLGYALVYMKEFEKAAEYLRMGLELVKQKNDENYLPELRDLYNRCLPHLCDEESWKDEPVEIIWSEEQEEYIVTKGAINLGYFGKFYSHQMTVGFDAYEYEDIFTRDYDCGDLKNYLSENMSHEEIAKGLTEFYNQRLKDIQKHMVEINQAFLANVMEDVWGTDYHFWESCPSYVVADQMPSVAPNEMKKAIYTNEVFQETVKLSDKYYKIVMNGEVDNIPYVENFLEEKMPMFDYKKMLRDVYAEYLSLDCLGITVQCSGAGEALNLVCSACVAIQNDNSFYDWHNH